MSFLFSPPVLAQGGGGVLAVILIIILVIAALAALLFATRFLGLWIQAAFSGAPVGFFALIGMWLRKVNPKTIVLSRIQAVKAGIDVSTNQMETHYLARGNVPRVVNALIAADRAKIQLDWNTACAIDLAGRDILEAVQTSVKPKVTPKVDSGSIPARTNGLSP